MSEESGGGKNQDKKGSPSMVAAKTLSSSINAAPFVPPSFSGNGSAELTTPRGTPLIEPRRRGNTIHGFSLDAPEFVPSSSGSGVSLAQAAVTATPFVPRASGRAQESNVGSKAKLSPDAAAFVPRTTAQDGFESPKRTEATSYQTAVTNGGGGGGGGNARRGGEVFQDPEGAVVISMVGNQRRGVPRGSNGMYTYTRTPRTPAKPAFSGYSVPAAGGGRFGGRGRSSRAHPFNQSNPNSAFLVSPGKMHLASEFMGEQLRRDMQQRTYLCQAQLSEEAASEVCIPPLIQNYHSLYPLEDMGLASEQPSISLGVHTCVMKGVSMVDGAAYTLRRINGREVQPSPALLKNGHDAVDRWSTVSNHPNLVGLRGVFASSEMLNVSSLFFVHDYHPGSVTLHFAHIQNQTAAGEDQLWSYLVHMAAAIRAVHSAGLALRPEGLMSTQILLTSNGRLRINSIGICNVLEGDRTQNQDITLLHRQDLTALGKLMLNLACAGRDPGLSPLDHCAIHYSMDLVRLISSLLASAEDGHLSSWRHLAAALSDRSLAALDSVNTYNDGLIKEMAKEVENGRLMRLMVKLGMANERDGNGFADSQWSETGDQYLLKLFRDFVFHQTTEEGVPVIDWGHVIECLNKLDAGVSEQIILMSRDERSLLVVTYADVKRCLETAYAELKGQGDASTASPQTSSLRHP
ncbi:hypothetical protein BSKO_05138 [Bryopsis sp. KO-2023]|nr:hypothetical protein BSKO_05138 [Bryopsis sp. KO-2023]